ncbi:GntR family transcriptional regulator [Oceanobacillus jeddahense]|uniref:GntR family transcriptional regulator n=1 Tax=Oceanobacillus jeddahense TaxID=1462527 RepID=A0ABY5JXC7_9BACI|nr:GntR family transcriptional regulator [Oceanobacillus jeddahense]UUI03686.1 GntR family transcriptional regulator [Oceanobacillus jeddahense]
MKKRDFIADDILSKIYQNKYKVGQKLPTERKLAEIYGVSRYTIREAIKKLVEIGSIKVIQGSGSIVNDTKYKSPLIYNSLTQKKFTDIQSQIVYFKKIKPDDELLKIFDLHSDQKTLWEYQRIRIIDYQKRQIETSRLPYILFPDFTEEDVTLSIHEFVQRCGYKISHFITSYTPVNLDKEQATLLNCKKGTAAMKIINRGMLHDGRVFEYSEMVSLDYSVSYFTPFDPSNHQYRAR